MAKTRHEFAILSDNRFALCDSVCLLSGNADKKNSACRRQGGSNYRSNTGGRNVLLKKAV